MYSVGLDVGERCSSVEILDSYWQTLQSIWRSKAAGRCCWSEIEREVPRPFAVCFEGLDADTVTCMSGCRPWPSGIRWRTGTVAADLQEQTRAQPGGLRKAGQAAVSGGGAAGVGAPSDAGAELADDDRASSAIAEAAGLHSRTRLALLQGAGDRGAPLRQWSGKGVAWLKTLELPEPQALLRDIMADQLQEVNRQASSGWKTT